MATAEQATKEGLVLVRRIEASRGRVLQNVAQINGAKPTWATNGDFRVYVFDNILKSLQVARLSIIFVATDLLSADWWETNFPGEEFEDPRDNIHTFQSTARYGLGLRTFFTVEHLFRTLLQCLGGGSHPKERLAWWEIRRELDAALASKFTQDELDLLSLMANIRNLVHHDGVFMPKNPGDITVVWGNIHYRFIDGHSIEFATWEMLLDLLDALTTLMARIVLDPNIASILAPLHTPSYPPPL